MSENVPKNTEESTRRYLQVYRKLYRGKSAERVRLEKMTQSAISRLGKICPRFYETKLPSMINQACSILSLYDTNQRQDAESFHRSHSIFLAILNELKKSQPQGDVDYHQEKKRYTEKKRLIKRHLALKKELEHIDSIEIVTEVHEEYASTMNKRNKITSELENVSIELALIDGQHADMRMEFKLIAGPNSMLKRLSKEELKNLEGQMAEFCNQQGHRTALYSDTSIIKGMFEKLEIAPERFQEDQIKTMMRDAVDACRTYFRQTERAEWHSSYDDLLSCKPKTGDIIDPDALPDHVKKKMDEAGAEGERKLERMIESYADRICHEEVTFDDGETSPNDSGEEMRASVMKRLKQEGILVERVKEEPSDG